MKVETIRYRDGRVHTIKYTYVDIPAHFDHPPKVESRWDCY